MEENAQRVLESERKKRKSGRRQSYLSLDVDDSVRLGLGVFKHSTCFAGQESHMPISLLQQLSRSILKNKAGTLLIRLKAKFFSDESNLYVGFVSAERSQQRSLLINAKKRQDSRFTNAGQRSQAFAIDKHVHKVCTHVGRVKVKLKETMVVTEGQCRPHIQRVLYSQVRFICRG